jgi:hypothetical protein
MTAASPPRDRRAGIVSFDTDDDLPIPTPEQRAAAKTAGEGLGFTSERSTSQPAPARASTRVANFTANFHIRTRPEDRQRFDDFVYRHRMTKGAAMTLLLDIAEAHERQLAEQASEPNP